MKQLFHLFYFFYFYAILLILNNGEFYVNSALIDVPHAHRFVDEELRLRMRELITTLDLNPYHSSKEIYNELLTLSSHCQGMELGQTKKSNITMTWVKLKPIKVTSSSYIENSSNTTNNKNNKKEKILMFFGEHARELISPELSLYLIQLLCTEKTEFSSSTQLQVQKIREISSFLIFPNINQKAREKVEEGEYCLRTNLNGIDLNRNWDDHWVNAPIGPAQTSGGRSAFSEVETQILRDAATEFKPTQFYTVHSGALSMLSPYAYEPTMPAHIEKVDSLLAELAPLYCNCAHGNAAKELGYVCPGTCLDYIFDKLNVQFSYAFEIYALGHKLPTTSTDSKFVSLSSLEKLNKKIKRNDNFIFNQLHEQIMSKTHSTLKRPRHGTPEYGCFIDFNPPQRSEYIATIENWSRACLNAFHSVAQLHTTAL